MKLEGLEVDVRVDEARPTVLNVDVRVRQDRLLDHEAIESAVRGAVLEAAQGYLHQQPTPTMMGRMRDAVNTTAKEVGDTLEEKDGIITWLVSGTTRPTGIHARCLYCAGRYSQMSLAAASNIEYHRAVAGRLVQHQANCPRKLVVASNEAASR